MATEKYTCRCGRHVNQITSYFKEGIRVTVCDDCAEMYELTTDDKVQKVDYEEVRKDVSKQTIDTREKA